MPTMSPVFASLPPGVEGHFRLHIYALVTRLLAHVRRAVANDPATNWFERFPFLGGYDSALRALEPPGLPEGELCDWWERCIAEFEAHTTDHLPLRALVEGMALGADDVRVLIAAGLVEEDIRFGALFAALQEPMNARRPCVGLLSWLVGAPGGALADAWPACRALIELGLLHAENQSDPRAEWLIRVPPAVWDALRGQLSDTPASGLTRYAAETFPLLDDVIVPDDMRSQLANLPALLTHDRTTAVVLRGMSGVGRRTVLGAVARVLGRDLLVRAGEAPGDASWRLLGPLATLIGGMPALRCDPGPGETFELPLLPGYNGPVGVTLGRSGGLRGPLLANALSLNLLPPDSEARRCFWQSTDVPIAAAAVDEIAERFLLTGGHIRRAATLAFACARLDGRESIQPADVRQAARSLNRQALETLATPLDAAEGWSDLIVSTGTGVELQTLVARCRERERLRLCAGPAFGRSLNRGVRAMFSGPSGTGKTLAARVLAAILQMDLYRVDLAAVVNKYIGETERNLNHVLSRAEELDVLLLLDEGDALMTKRTEVRNANDRYANLETNYLLQRLESYEGVVIITTNAAQRIDPAFTRRIDVIVDFAPPEAGERWLIWQHHLPRPNTISPALLEDIAVRCALTGGQIRNAALHATLLAMGDNAQPNDFHLEAALQREYRQAGASYPLRVQPAANNQMDRLRRFAAELG